MVDVLVAVVVSVTRFLTNFDALANLKFFSVYMAIFLTYIGHYYLLCAAQLLTV